MKYNNKTKEQLLQTSKSERRRQMQKEFRILKKKIFRKFRNKQKQEREKKKYSGLCSVVF